MSNAISKSQNKEVTVKNIEEFISVSKVITPEEKDLILNDFNDTYAEYSKERTLVDIFEEQVKKTPNNVAVLFDNIEITYKELNERANSLAMILRENRISSDDIIAIISERSINMIVGIIASLKAGAAYLPIDSEYPENRINYILKNSNAKAILIQEKFKEKVNQEIFMYDLDDENLYKYKNDNLNKVSNGSNLAYVIYTSGTTGNPKGVMIEHNSIINYVLYAKEQYLNEENLYMPLYTSISFDLTITSIFTPLISGNTIVIYKEKEIDLLMKKVFQFEKNSVIKVTPAHLSLLKEIPNVNKNIRKIIVGGEELKESLAKEISAMFDNKIDIINEYGPTEATVGCITHKYDSTKQYDNTVLIGKPINNFKIYIVDNGNNMLPIGEIGEICISGNGLARGYLNNDKLTEEKFINNPYEKGQKMYKTGDLARWLSDGSIQYLGRIDDQVKIRGYRIELSEIDTEIRKIKDIKDVAIIARENNLGENEINAYIISEDSTILKKVKEQLKLTLPEYMIPQKFMLIDAFPLTPNGKIDKKALFEIKEENEINYVAPNNPLEEEIVDLWREMLDIDVIGIDDNFLEVGGHSLIATKIVYKINEIYNVDLSLVEFFTDGLTVRNLSNILEEKLFASISEEELESMLNEIE
ncbi:amino acid adenylation domain-containing protein [Clostridium cavendishii DSM 21758]|uniref:Amino acid adenylation domain-containing protein n=1 Tax=Clostridium cavendishii DSM 21758 TaxID=1121302 RepID=A0A1M6N747_9CLOT|nr:non-ribosomal peptide synthetase [Clostridium cavendishii]SHJ91538.1 amino acid adenylation domain-containing protein [Clostridium cavendishii DSM 21758]